MSELVIPTELPAAPRPGADAQPHFPESPRPTPSWLTRLGRWDLSDYAFRVFLMWVAGVVLLMAVDWVAGTFNPPHTRTWEPAPLNAVQLFVTNALDVWTNLLWLAGAAGLVAQRKYGTYIEKDAAWVAAHNGAVEQAKDHRLYALWDQWEATRPLAQVIHSTEPLGAIRGLVSWYGGTAYLGLVADTQDLAVLPRNQSAIIIAPGQSGKTTGVNNPSINVAPGAALVTSTKPDVMDETVPARRLIGQCWIFDPMGETSDAELPAGVERAYVSPVESAYTWDRARLTVDGLVGATGTGNAKGSGDTHWKESAKAVLAPLLFAAAQHPDLTIHDVRHWLARKQFEVPLAVIQAVMDDENHPQCIGARLAMDDLQERLTDNHGDHMADVLSTASTVLKAYGSEDAAKNAHRVNFDLAAFVRSTDTLYICSPEHVQEELAPVIIWLIEAIYKANSDLDKEQPFHKTGRPPLLAAIDEAANIAPSKKLPRFVSEGQGKGFQCLIQLQSLAQARDIWGAVGGALIDTAMTKVIFGGISDKDTLEAFSVLTGDYDRTYVSNTQSWTLTNSEGTSDSRTSSLTSAPSTTRGTTLGSSYTAGGSTSTSVKKERQMTPADVATLPPGHALVVRKGQWSVIEIVTTHHAPWQHVIAASEAQPVNRPTPPNLRRPVPPLPPISDLVGKVRNDRTPPAHSVAIPSQVAPQAASKASIVPPVVDLVSKTVPPAIKLVGKLASRLLAATEPAGAAARPEDATARSGGSSRVATANAVAEARARSAQSVPRLVRLRVVEDVNDIDDAGL